MNEKNPMESLEGYYAGLQPAPPTDLIAGVYRRKARRSQKAFGAACGMCAGLAAVVALTTWATRPVPTSGHGSQAIARYQMMNSGIARRSGSDLLEGVR